METEIVPPNETPKQSIIGKGPAELQNVIERALIISQGNPLTFGGLSGQKQQMTK